MRRAFSALAGAGGAELLRVPLEAWRGLWGGKVKVRPACDVSG